MSELSGADGAAYYDLTMPDGRTISCNDVIDALGMSFNRGEAFKALWRMGRKPGTPALYDAEKVVYFSERELARLRRDEPVLPLEWIEWNGGACPVDPEAKVQTLLRNETPNDFDDGAGPAGDYTWSHSNSEWDIIAYRLAS